MFTYAYFSGAEVDLVIEDFFGFAPQADSWEVEVKIEFEYSPAEPEVGIFSSSIDVDSISFISTYCQEYKIVNTFTKTRLNELSEKLFEAIGVDALEAKVWEDIENSERDFYDYF